MKVLKTSEFWMAILTAILQVCVSQGLLEKTVGEQGVFATAAYVLGRVISKIVKR